MDWIFQEAYKVVQKLLDGTLSSQQLIPFLTIIILFGGLLKRRQIAEFIRSTIQRTRDYMDLEHSKTELAKQRAEVRRSIKQIEEELTKVEGYKAKFDTKFSQTIADINRLPTSHPLHEQDKSELRVKINELDKFYRNSLNNFKTIENLLKGIAEIRRGDVLINNSDEIAESAVARARAKLALRNKDSNTQANLDENNPKT